MNCNQCDVMTINGMVCHETGCPSAKYVAQDCKWCGQEFAPTDDNLNFCDDGCAEAFYY